MICLGLALSNGLIAMGGSIEAQRAGGFHSGMGLGIMVVSLACLIVGESLVRARVKRTQLRLPEELMAVPLGVLAYQFGLQLLLQTGFTFVDVRLTAVTVLLVFLAVASRRHPNTESLGYFRKQRNILRGSK